MSLLKKITLVAALSSLSFAATAGDAGVTGGIKFGKSMIDIAGADDGNSKGLSLGYDFGNSFSAELDILSGDASGIDIDTKAIYGTYRSEGKGYFLAKIGYLNEKLKYGSYSESDSGLSYGIGGGFRINDKFSVELEYTIIEADVNFLGLGARYKF
jgi:outer membrane immunogenic protein